MKTYDEETIRRNYSKLTKLLIEKELTITTMESCTAGQIASLITDTEGSSAILKGAFVTYCNEAKILQGVSRDVIEKFSVYSEETAQEMAKSCQQAYGSDISIGVTGTMGNIDPQNEEASTPGDVYFSVRIGNKSYEDHTQIPAQPNRLSYKLAVAEEIYEFLMLKFENDHQML